MSCLSDSRSSAASEQGSLCVPGGIRGQSGDSLAGSARSHSPESPPGLFFLETGQFKAVEQRICHRNNSEFWSDKLELI